MDYQEQVINDFLKTKPETITVIAYGSAIKKQDRDKNIIKKQIDLILGVKNPKKWHKENKKKNPKDYTFIGYNILTKLPDFITNIGTNINYLAYLTHNNNQFKIGVIQNDLLIDDLVNWNNGYMAGRMQKSVRIIKGSKEIKEAIMKNRENALKVSLILLQNNELTEEKLYEKICGLSYNGDIRMRFKMENPNKVKDIAKGSYLELSEIYNSLNKNYYTKTEKGIKINYEKIIKESNNLPKKLLKNIDIPKDTKIETLKKLRTQIEEFTYKNNLKTSIAQPIKGTLINGITKSVIYARNKRRKHNIYK